MEEKEPFVDFTAEMEKVDHLIRGIPTTERWFLCFWGLRLLKLKKNQTIRNTVITAYRHKVLCQFS